MCTVTIIPHESGIRLACNRDESRARPIALPPRIVVAGERRALMPIDPQSAGTWIAANDAGLIFALLNTYAGARVNGSLLPKRSRGTIIPKLAAAPTWLDAVFLLKTLPLADFAPFRLVMANRFAYKEFGVDGRQCERRSSGAIAKPLLFTSSGLGDALVDQPRRALFDEFFVPGADWRERQDAYHRHSWPDRRHLSVCMSRADARTVSFTTVEIVKDRVRMAYFPDAPDFATTPVLGVLSLAGK